jgi:hypothetical protein
MTLPLAESSDLGAPIGGVVEGGSLRVRVDDHLDAVTTPARTVVQ